MPGLIERIPAALDARLSPDADRPVAVALSGGGDSMALLHLAADWAGGRGRRLLALTVDHGLNPDSADWTAFAGRAARALGADWRGLSWGGPKPATGLPAAARAARHALLADAARAAGARVILMAHTADDRAESDWMRGQGATLGALREWAPSPAWPEGRGVMLMRPLLDVRRAELRAFLKARSASWLEDPANTDPRFLRSRARAALSADHPSSDGRKGSGRDDPALRAGDEGSAYRRDAPGPHLWAGLLILTRAAPARVLAAALLSASGGAAPPRGRRLAALHARIVSGADFTATLAGARVEAVGETVCIMREPGRRGLADLVLTPNEPLVWDGRFEITAFRPGWRVGPLKGRTAALADADRSVLNQIPASARPALPVLFRDDGSRPVLAWRNARTRCLVAARLVAAVGGIGHEGDLDRAIGETPPSDLFLNIGEDVRPA